MKIHSQVKAVSKLGYKSYLFIINANKVRLYEIHDNEEKILFDKKSTFKRFSNKRNIFDEFFLFNLFCKELLEVIDYLDPHIVYFRRIVPITPKLINTIKAIKKKNIKIFYEYPTFPWEKEYIAEKKYLFYILDRIQFKILKNQITKLVTVGTKQGQYPEYINISNAIDVSTISKRNPIQHTGFNMIGVANVNIFHGFDRVVVGLKNYYQDNPSLKVYFHIVGDVREDTGLKELVKICGLNSYVIFHGYKSGKDLDLLFDYADVAIGCLGVHRKDVNSLNSLKNREYTARGIPFVFSEHDEAIEKKAPDFIYKPSFDDSPIDINEIIKFCSTVQSTPDEIRNFAIKYLNWESEMRKILIT